MPTSGSRAEFLAVDELGASSDIKYGRTGGWFVSTKKAILLGLLVILAMVLVGILVHYIATWKGEKLIKDIDTANGTSVQVPSAAANTSVAPSISAAELLLPTDITPQYYRLQLEPYLEDTDPDGNNFTYYGHVSIRIQCHNATDKVSLHLKHLQIIGRINISLFNDTGIETRTTSAWTSSSRTPASAPIYTTNDNSTTSDVVLTTPEVSSNDKTKTTTDSTTTTPAGHRNKRNAAAKRRHRRNHDTSTTPVPKTTVAAGTPLRVTGHVQEDKKEINTISLEPALEAGRTYVLDIKFKGLLKGSLYGFYRSSYKNKNGTRIWMASTQFEATHARKAFPCFDEPAMKAEFEISISRRVDMITLSNMPIRATEPIANQPGRVWDHYEVSPKMSPYLVAYIVAPSDFMPTNNTMVTYVNKSSPEFRIYARKQLLETTEYASSIGPRVLEFYGDYFNIPYPLPNLHMAAIPDFAAGAMENWGLLNYRESTLLYDPKSSSMSDKENVAIVVAHELAHQWFGNLVTMKWWSDLWLNEGFATYMQYVGSNHVEPSWAMQDKFLVYEQQPAMALDCLKSTHPVSTRVDNPSQISEVFDSISYSKGASLIRMLDNSLTQDVLRKGLTRYLNKWKYNNAEENDLWEALMEQIRETSGSSLPTNVTVKQVMDSWTLQDGYPVLNVTRDYNDGSATLAQARFVLDNSSSDTLWYIPVSYTTQEETNDATDIGRKTFPRIWLKQEPTITIPNLTKPKSFKQWVLFNIQATGYYRVNYDSRNWELLADHLLSSPLQDELPAITRAQLLDDALNLARAGILGYDVALNVTRYLATKEMDYVPWKAFHEQLRFLNLMLRQTTAYGDFQNYVLSIQTAVKNKLGFAPTTSETQPETLLRPYILSWLSKMDDPEFINWAKDLFRQWTNSSNPDTDNPINVDVRQEVYCTAVRTGGREEWEFILQRFQAAVHTPSESDVLLASLVCTRHEWLLLTLLKNCMEGSGGFRLQDAVIVWNEMRLSVVSTRVAFNFIRSKWEAVYDKYGKDEFLIGHILHGAVSGLTTEVDYKDLKEFYNTNKGKFRFAERKMEQEVEGLQLRVEWRKRNYKTISSWLEKYHEKE